jgi:hypothetical protein
MRRRADRQRIDRFTTELGRLAKEPTTVYLSGGATAVVYGWRLSTIDIDLRLEPERDELLRAIVELKERLSVNVELASPLDFIPEPPGWRDRSPFVAQEGALTVRHMDPYAQVLAKIERGHALDQADVQAMLEQGLIEPAEVRRHFAAIEPGLYRFPAINVPAFRSQVEAALKSS